MPSTVYMVPGNDDRTSHCTPIVFASAKLARPVADDVTVSDVQDHRVERASRHMSLISAAGRGNALTPTHL